MTGRWRESAETFRDQKKVNDLGGLAFSWKKKNKLTMGVWESIKDFGKYSNQYLAAFSG